MSRVQKLRMFVSQRLNAALGEILEAFQETIVKYEEEAALSREVIARQHALLCALNNPTLDAPTAEVFTQRLLHSKEVSNNQNQNPSQDLVSGPLRVEEKQQEQQLQDLDEVEIIEFTYNSNKAINPRHSFQTPGSVPNQNDLRVSSTETEDSDDYSRDSAEARPASEKQEGLCRPKDSVSCRACSRTFTARRFLFRHVRAHVRDTKPVCGLCGEQFEVAGRLKLHLKTHSKTRKLQIHVRTRSREVRLQQLSDLNKNKETEKLDDSSKTLTKKRPRGRPKNVKLDRNNPAKNNKRKRTI